MNVVLSSIPLYLVPLLVALGALASLVTARGAGMSKTAGPNAARVVGASIVAAMAALAIAGRPLLSGQRVFSHALRLARVGSLDANLGFWLDTKSAVLAFALLVLGLFSVLTPSLRRRTPASQAGIGLAVSALLVSVLGDGFATLLTGWTAFGIVVAVLVGATSPRAGARALGTITAGALMLALGSGLVFWGLGGRYLDGRRYLSDYRAPFEASSKEPTESATKDVAGVHPPKVGDKSYLTVLTRPGAKVYLGLANDSQLTPRTEPFAIAPFVRAELPAGLQKVTIDPGGGTILGGDSRDIALIQQVRFPPNEEVEVRAVGPSITFREIDRQLDASASTFAERQLGSFRIVDGACIAFGLAGLGLVMALGGSSARERRTGAMTDDPRVVGFAGGFTSILAAVIGGRLSGIFAASPSLGGVVTLLALGVALFAALRSARAFRSTTFVAESSRTVVALVLAASASSASAGAMSLAVAAAFSLVAIGIVLERATNDVDELEPLAQIEIGAGLGEGSRVGEGTSLAIAVLALAGSPVPFVGVFVGVGAIGAAALARGGALGVAIALLAAAAWAALAHAVYRAYFCVSHAVASPTDLTESPLAATPQAGKNTAKQSAAEGQGRAKKSSTDSQRARGASLAAPGSSAPTDRTASAIATAACVAGPLVGVMLGVLEQPVGQTTTARVLVFAALAIPAAIAGHLARARYSSGRPADWAARDRRGALEWFCEAKTPRENRVRDDGSPGSLARLILGLEQLLDAPLDLLARLASRSSASPKDDA